MRNLPERLKALHSRAPERVAVMLQFSGKDDLPLSYNQLLRGSHAFARTLRRERIQPGEVVVLILQHSQELVYSFWGAILHGAIPAIMPFLTEKLSPERYRTDLSSLISVTKPAAIVTYPEFEADVRSALTKDDSVRAVILTNPFESQSEIHFADFRGFERGPDDIVLLQHSSGTTGLQKGVALSHQAVFNQLDAYGKSLALNENDVVVSWLPLYHDMGLIAGFLMPMLSGIPLVLMSPF
ncbi:MAG TPA: AMP-binding protein, partial [Anaerolineales bacterium]